MDLNKMVDDISFLKELQQELKTQEIDCQASPRFWVIRDRKTVACWEDQADYMGLYDDEGEVCDIRDLLGYVLEERDYLEVEDKDVEELNEIYSTGILLDSELLDWYRKYIDDSARLVPCKEEFYIVPNTMFLTKKEAQEHIESNRHHYTTKVHTYAMTAWRAPKVKRLLEILETFDFYEQAERAQELEEFKQAMEDRYKIWHIGAKKSLAEKERLEQQNKRYREALEFYADRDNYIPFYGIFLSSYQNKVDEDGGKKARQALEG